MNALYKVAQAHMQYLCVDLPGRHLGSVGNRAATTYVRDSFLTRGVHVETQEFSCLDWEPLEERLQVDEEMFLLHASPYSRPCDARGPLRLVQSVCDLAGDLRGSVLLLRGELVRHQLVPKNYPFYSVQEHRELLERLEQSGAVAVVAATDRDPMSAAALSPFPLIEDGDFTLPCAHLSEAAGQRLAALQGKTADIRMRVRREPAHGVNVVGRMGKNPARHVVCAHVDAKRGSPGAIDNASGTTVLLLLAELLRGCEGVELVAFNGEEDYSAAGELEYMRRRDLRQFTLTINVDGIGFCEGVTAFSSYGLAAEPTRQLDQILVRPGLRRGPDWIQSDHAIFVQQGIPALAMTTSEATWVASNIAHTDRDRVELVDPAQLVETAEAIGDVLRAAAGPW